MHARYYPADFDVQARTVLIMLPGAMQQPGDFIDAGFVRAVKSRGVPLDLHLASFDIETIADVTSTMTLQQIDITLIQPAIRAGYARIWLGGISMGALMALAYTDYRPGKVQALCLVSPYPGNRLLLREIAAAGGLDEWRAKNDPDLDAEQRMWRRLQTRVGLDNVHLGYGSGDRFFDGLQQLALALPNAAVDVIAGGHDWPTWEKLWCNFLDGTSVMELT